MDELELENVAVQKPALMLYEFPHVSRGTDPVPEVWHRAINDANSAKRLFGEKRYEGAGDLYLAVAALLPESAAIGIYGGEFAAARAIAYQNAALCYKAGGMAVKAEKKLSAIDDRGARDGLVKAIDLLSE